MAPLLVTALVGIGVKIATDLVAAGAREVFRPSAPAASFAAALDKARATSGAASAGAADTRSSVLDAGLADRSRMLALEVNRTLPTAAHAHGFGSYRRLDEVPETV